MRNRSDLAKLVAQIHQIGVSIVFGSSADIDIMDPDQVVLGLYQAGLVRSLIKNLVIKLTYSITSDIAHSRAV